ncbi:unnamed protein product, partial [Prorocentrum cordatum]
MGKRAKPEPSGASQLAGRGGGTVGRGGGAGGRGTKKSKMKAAAETSKESQVIGPLMIRTKSVDLAGPKGSCGRCGFKENAEHPFPDVKFPGEEIKKFPFGCSFHVRGFVKGKFWMDYIWPTLCGACENDSELADSFEACCQAADGKRFSATLPQDVTMGTQTGITVYSDCVLITDAQYQTDIAPAGAQSLTPQQAGERATEVQNEHEGDAVTGTLALDPTSPYLRVRRFTTTLNTRSEKALSADDCCREGAASSLEEAANKLMREQMPITLRGNVGIPTVAELKARALGAARGLGLLTDPTPPAAPTGKLAIADGSVDDGGGAAALPPGDVGASQGPASLGPNTDDTRPPRSAFDNAIQVPDAVPAGAARGSMGDDAGPLPSGASDHSRGASSMMTGTPPSVKKPGVANDASEKARLKELKDSISLGRVLTKGKDHGIGDKIYALRRWKPDSDVLGGEKDNYLGDIDWCTTLGGKAIEQMGQDTRLRLLGNIKHVDLSDAVPFKLQLCAVAAKEMFDVGGKVEICIPWKQCAGEFSMLHPRFSAAGVPDAELVETGRTFFINSLVLPYTKQDKVHNSWMMDLIDQILPRVKSEAVREEAGVCKDLAKEIYVYAESLRILIDPSPTALLECDIRSEVRKFLREEAGPEWRVVVTTFGSEWKACLEEYNRSYHTDVKYGEKVSSVERVPGDAIKTLTVQDISSIIANLKEWGPLLRLGAARNIMNHFRDKLEDFIKKSVLASDIGHQAVPDIEEVTKLNLEFLDLLSLTPKLRAISEDTVQAFNKIYADLEMFQEKVYIKGKSDKLVEACDAYDPKRDETVQKIAVALTESQGAHFGSGEVVAELIGCARTCFNHVVQMGLDFTAEAEATDAWAETAEMMKKMLAVAAGAVNRIGEFDADAREIHRLVVTKMMLIQLMMSIGAVTAREPFADLHVDLADDAQEDPEQPQGEGASTTQGADGSDGADGKKTLEVTILVDFKAFEALANVAIKTGRDLLKEFSTVYWDLVADATEYAVKDMDALSGGIMNGGGKSWTDGPSSLQNWEEVLTQIKATLFKQKGLATKARALKGDILKQLGELKKTADEHGKMSEFGGLEASALKAAGRTEATLFEARFAQLVKGGVHAKDHKACLLAFRDELYGAKYFKEKDIHPVIAAKLGEMLTQ